MEKLNYGLMMQRAMQRLVAEVLSVVADSGVPGDHHFYITFKTAHPGVDMPGWLRQRFPEEMIIVLQHEFYDLAVTEDRFSVKLSFNNRLATLVVPFDAITQFADPSAEFGLRFDPMEPGDDDDDDDIEAVDGGPGRRGEHDDDAGAPPALSLSPSAHAHRGADAPLVADEAAGRGDDVAGGAAEAADGGPDGSRKAGSETAASAEDAESDEKSGEVVSLDAFRKK